MAKKKQIKINLRNCYGIKNFEHTFDFSEKNTLLIYAPNGTMKSSFAKVLQDFSLGETSVDRIYPDRKTSRDIAFFDGFEFKQEDIVVIHPYDSEFRSERITDLVASEEISKSYESIVRVVKQKENDLLAEISRLSGVQKEKMKFEILGLFPSADGDFANFALGIEQEILAGEPPQSSIPTYKVLMSDQVKAKLDDNEFKTNIGIYVETYKKLLSQSKLFHESNFTLHNIREISTSLKANHFFENGHSLIFNIDGAKIEIPSQSRLNEMIEQERNKVLESPEIKGLFDTIDKSIKNQDLRDFREYIAKNQHLIADLIDLDGLKRKLIKFYLKGAENPLALFIGALKSCKKEIDDLTTAASEQTTEWQEVVKIFSDRFVVPFTVKIENKEEVILKGTKPSLSFEFAEPEEKIKVHQNKLIEALSTGEKRAFYILNVLFELEARRKLNRRTLIIVDDIADSFDYKNKYAIAEYLKDISENPNFFMVILTHNYDFYRTLSNRLELFKQSHIATFNSSKNSVILRKDDIYKNPFLKWQKQVIDEKADKFQIIALIPFVRNLAEFCNMELEETELTKILHIKDDTNSVKIKNLNEVFSSVLKKADILHKFPQDESVKPIIYELARNLVEGRVEFSGLEHKIVLAISARLKIEEYIISKIGKITTSKNQTGDLAKKFKSTFSSDPNERKSIHLIDRVNLMTPGHIHLNAFMYEILIDQSEHGLKKLASDIDALIAS